MRDLTKFINANGNYEIRPEALAVLLKDIRNLTIDEAVKVTNKVGFFDSEVNSDYVADKIKELKQNDS